MKLSQLKIVVQTTTLRNIAKLEDSKEDSLVPSLRTKRAKCEVIALNLVNCRS